MSRVQKQAIRYRLGRLVLHTKVEDRHMEGGSHWAHDRKEGLKDPTP